MAKSYVVWKGRTPGIYDTWDEAKAQVDRFPDAMFKSFRTREEAEVAFGAIVSDTKTYPNMESFSSDGSCCPCPGKMEYRFVDNMTGRVIASESFPYGTNNVAEFLGLVAAIRHVQENKINRIVYTDSATALSWLMSKHCNTTMKECVETIPVRAKIDEAVAWLQNNSITADVRKWETKLWGEVPADYDRK